MDATVGVLIPRDIAPTQFVEYAQRAESYGFRELWVVEDCGERGGIAQATVALSCTTHIRVGIGVLPAGVRNPVYVAMEAATLSQLYPRRIIMGIGHGMPKWMRMVGACHESPMTLLRETLECIHGLLHGRRMMIQGCYINLTDVGLNATPEHPPPVYAGVRGPKSLQLAGEVADGTILAEPVTPSYVAFARDTIKVPHHPIVAYNLAALNYDQACIRDEVRARVAHFGDIDWTPHLKPVDIGESFLRLRGACGSEEEFATRMPDEWVNELAIIGTPDEGRKRLRELTAAGVTTSVLIPIGLEPLKALAQLRSLL